MMILGQNSESIKISSFTLSRIVPLAALGRFALPKSALFAPHIDLGSHLTTGGGVLHLPRSWMHLAFRSTSTRALHMPPLSTKILSLFCHKSRMTGSKTGAGLSTEPLALAPRSWRTIHWMSWIWQNAFSFACNAVAGDTLIGPQSFRCVGGDEPAHICATSSRRTILCWSSHGGVKKSSLRCWRV
jgi:hypothetical protein